MIEAHKDGTPHVHMLLHEAGSRILYDHLWPCWWQGFFHAKLADEKSAYYVTKYVAKDLNHRIRASARYGLQSAAAGTEVQDPDKEPSHNVRGEPPPDPTGGGAAPGEG